MILTVQTNARSRVLLAATSAGEAVLEDLKADGMEAFIQDKDSKSISDVGYIEEDGKRQDTNLPIPNMSRMEKICGYRRSTSVSEHGEC